MSRKTPTTTDRTDAAKTARVPKLRFPEFRGAWVKKRLEDVAPLQRGFDLPSDLIRPGSIPIVYSNGIQKYHEVGMATAPGLVTGRSGTIGKLHFIESGAYWPHNTSLWVTNFRGNVPRFVYYLYDSIGMGRFSSGSGVPTLNRNDVHAFISLVPSSPAEQQKIADCLSSLDNLITAQARKVDALKTHKKSLMQQLFPREGETQPRLRFPVFKDSGEWEERRLGQLADFQSGGTPSKANSEFWNGSIPWVSAKDMKQLFLDDAEDHISAAAVDDGAKLVQPGSLLMLVRGMTLLKDVPICVVRREMSFNQDVKALRPNDSIDKLFMAFLLASSKDRLLEMVTVAGHGTGKLDTEELKAMNLMVPNRDEQRCIATCLSSLDALVTSETQRLADLKTHKKGLMQQLFPSPEEPAES